MNCVLVLVLPSLVLLSRTTSGVKATGNGTSCSDGTFVQSNQDNALTFFTDNTHGYNKVWFKPKTNCLHVMVKAPKDAHFKLQTSNPSLAYEIVIGSYENTKSDIRIDSGTLVKTSTVDVLRPNEYVPFVIAWNSSRIVVFKGTNDSDIVVEWTDPYADIDVLQIGLTGYQLQFQGGENDYEEYQFKETEVSSFWIKTPALSPYKRFQRTLYNVDGQRFELRTAREVAIAFLASPDRNFNQPTYRLTIGAMGNTQTILYDRSNQILVSNHTPGILNSTERRIFWVAWKDGRFAFGLGSKFYENSTLMTPNSTVVETFHSMAVDSTREARWAFPSKGGECLSQCPPNVGYTQDNELLRKCVCTYGNCCGSVAFRFCFIVLPCLLVAVILVPVVLFAARKLRRMYFIDPQRIDVDQLSKILSLVPAHVLESLNVENLRNRQESLGPNDVDVSMAKLLARDPGETPFSRDF